METSDFLLPVDDNFLCTICHNVMISPRACSQGHQFCCACISKWLRQSPTCPSRCGDLAVESLMNVRSVENLINKLQVRCHAGVADGPSPGPKNLRRRSRANVASSEGGPYGGCEWVGTVEERARHLLEECAYSEVACSCEGCDTKVMRRELAGHEASCEHREVSCEKCNQRLKAGEMGEHLLGCALVEVECPQECGARVLRGDLGEHEKECENVVVSCPFAEHGCSERGKRKRIVEHEEEAAVAHSRLAARQAGRERERNAVLEKEVTALAQKTSQVQKLEEELEESKRRVATLDRQLSVALQMKGGQSYAEERVTWRVEDFTAKAIEKGNLVSKVFHVQTTAGEYHLRLGLVFRRKAGCTGHGYVGLRVQHTSEDGGSENFPVGLGGSELIVIKGATQETKKCGDHVQLNLDRRWGWQNWMSTDKIRGLRWTDQDPEAGIGRKEPEYDVTDFLEDGTLTVKGYIRITPPEAEVEI